MPLSSSNDYVSLGKRLQSWVHGLTIGIIASITGVQVKVTLVERSTGERRLDFRDKERVFKRQSRNL